MFISSKKFWLAVLVAFIIGLPYAYSQSEYIPYSYSFYQRFDTSFYSTQNRVHTAFKANFASDGLLVRPYDSLTSTWTNHSKFFNGHLIHTKYGSDSRFYADLLPDIYAGEDMIAKKPVWLTAIGAQARGDLSSHFHYYLSFFANNGQLPGYINSYANTTGYIPGEGIDNAPGSNIKNWYYSTFLLSYDPAKFVDFELGKDKNFIGDGYRSMLLSDFASNYPFFKTTITEGNLQYVMMYAYLYNPLNTAGAGQQATNKWGYFQYVDWNISNRVSVGFFENTMEATTNTNGQKQGFNPSLAMPFTFLVAMDNIDNNPGKNLVGFTAKYKIFNKTVLYGQFALNEFHAKDILSGDGSVTNKSSYQLGFRGADLFKIKGLNYLAEFNTARPFTYSSFDQSSNYSQDGQPLADPLGANFREWLTILNYTAGRFSFQAQADYAFYGLDKDGGDYGQNIFEPYTDAANAYGNYVGQGIKTNFYYTGGSISYIINPKNNMRIELSSYYRQASNQDSNNHSCLILIGLRSSFRDIYTDF
jgi:hypothetical protein